MQRLPSTTLGGAVTWADRRSNPPRGFTLVEMLVAVALVMLLMALFAQVFQIAGGTVSTQRGLMENDQRARSVQTLLIGDLRKRTFRKVIPFTFNEDLTAPEADLANRQGYFYISENNPDDDTDDVLAFTVNALVKTDTWEDQPYYGKAIPLIPNGLNPGQQMAYFRSHTNQPEHDDGRLDTNNSADSPAAEVAYFLRGGNLYRRVLLIRKQLDRLQELQPMTNAGEKFFGRNTTGAIPYPASLQNTTQFWNDFDFSAHPRIIRDPNNSSQLLYDGAEFSGMLDSLPLSPSLPQMSSLKFPLALAYPPNRFGHDTINPTPLLSPPGFPFGGQPREYGLGGVNSWFVGRLTMQESSNTVLFPPSPAPPAIIPWTYPHLTHVVPNLSATDPQNPMNAAVVWHDNNGDRVIDEFALGTRRGEDLVLSHVHAFDVKVWDEALGEFKDIGYGSEEDSPPYGDFHLMRQLNPYYGPRTTADINAGIDLHNRVFDTWYPFRTEDVNGDGIFSLNEDTNNNGIQDPGESDSDRQGFYNGVWERSEDISGGTPGELDHIQLLDFNADGILTNEDRNGDGVVDAGENFPPYRPLLAQPLQANARGIYKDYERWIPASASPNRYTVGNRVFPSVYTDRTQFGDPFYYICVNNDANGDGTLDGQGSVEPLWPRIAGLKVTDGDLVWQAVDNRKRLRAIQITLRFLDPTTQQMRTLTIQHSLVD